MQWTEEQYQALLNAIEKGGSTQGVIDMAADTTSRTPKSVVRKLKKIGYLRNSGQSFLSKQGFVSL
ncbi:MAG TPA: hypothetical protein VFC74_01520 [Oscillospiraceae bacterium]|nr:hypothetical protein [Oscillospiraceae bacterium]